MMMCRMTEKARSAISDIRVRRKIRELLYDSHRPSRVFVTSHLTGNGFFIVLN